MNMMRCIQREISKDVTIVFVKTTEENGDMLTMNLDDDDMLADWWRDEVR